MSKHRKNFNKNLYLNKIIMILSLLFVVFFVVGCSQAPASNTPSGATPVKGGSESVNTQPTTTSSDTTSTTSTADTPIKDIEITAYDFGFRQTGPQINVGDKVRLTFTVESGTHSLVLSGYNIEFTPMTAGKTQSAVFIATKGGKFEYHCNNPCGPGHADMVGELIVNSA